MRSIYIKMLVLVATFGLLNSSVFAQEVDCTKADSLTEVSLQGIALVDTTVKNVKFFIDVDGDSLADYRLNFGPWWYQPDSGNANRPENWDSILILGGINEDKECVSDSLPIVIVYEINNAYWRDPYEPSWARKGKFHKRHRNSYRNHKGFAFGWLNDSLETITVDGSVLVDTTFNFWHYYLDSDGDTLPDYFLNFGPPWYEPASGLQKPAEGDLVSVTGAVALKVDPPLLFVFELNGETWLDTTGYGSQMGASWIHRNMNQERRIKTTFDSLNQIQVRTGWNDGTGPNPLPDKLFCQMLQLFPENMPYGEHKNTFAGFEVGVFTENGKNMMVKKDSTGGMIQFKNALKFQFHYTDIQIKGQNRNENTIQARHWVSETAQWVVIDDATLDPENNTVSFESMNVPGLIILTADEVTSIASDSKQIPMDFVLNQNYPNPFNPQTTIEFNLQKDSFLTLTIYNVLGQELKKLAEGTFKAGINRITFSSEKFPSGTYFYELKTKEFSQVKKMTLVR